MMLKNKMSVFVLATILMAEASVVNAMEPDAQSRVRPSRSIRNVARENQDERHVTRRQQYRAAKKVVQQRQQQRQNFYDNTKQSPN